MRSFLGRDILSLKEFERNEYFHVFEVAERASADRGGAPQRNLLEDKTLLTAFYQPSTRTRLATEAAMHRLGGHVLGFSDAKMTRAGDFYQESIKDTVHMLEYYGDVIAMRHFQQGAPAEAARWASVPVINCGDGWGEHPTQVLTDLYTIWRELGRLDGRADPPGRRHADAHDAFDPVRGLAVRRGGFVVSPAEMSLLPEFKDELDERNVVYREVETVEKVIGEADVIYMEPVVQADYTKSRDERGTEEAGRTPGRLPGHPGAAPGQGQARFDRPALAAPDGRAAPRRGRHAARPLLGRRRSTASSCGWRCCPWSWARSSSPGGPERRRRTCRPESAART